MERFLELRLFRYSKPKKKRVERIESFLVKTSAITWAEQYINPNWDNFQLVEYMGHRKDYGYGIGYDPIAVGSCE